MELALPPMDPITWLGIVFCLTQSAMFSGLNLAYFSIGRMQLEAEAEGGNESARRVLELREDANLLLCTILWGNVAVNVLLALLSESVLNGVAAFAFSTVGITFFGEIIPQAYFSRNAMRMAAALGPVIRFYRVLLFVVAKPSALVLDGWIGPEGPTFLRERDMELILQKHIRESDSEIGETEGRGALNFLTLDDRLISDEGVAVAPETILSFTSKLDLPMLPCPSEPGGVELVETLSAITYKWTVITDEEGHPMLALDTPSFLREVVAGTEDIDIYAFCHRPIVVQDPEATLDTVLDQFVVEAEHHEDWVIDRDVILYWSGDVRRIITGADILGRLLQGIAQRTHRVADLPG